MLSLAREHGISIEAPPELQNSLRLNSLHSLLAAAQARHLETEHRLPRKCVITLAELGLDLHSLRTQGAPGPDGMHHLISTHDLARIRPGATARHKRALNRISLYVSTSIDPTVYTGPIHNNNNNNNNVTRA